MSGLPGALFSFVLRARSGPEGYPKLQIECSEIDVLCAPGRGFGSGASLGHFMVCLCLCTVDSRGLPAKTLRVTTYISLIHSDIL